MKTGGVKTSRSLSRDTSAQIGSFFPGTEYSLAQFVQFAKILGIDVEPFQRRDLKPYFDGCRELIVVVPKKNGKTTLLSALMLYHLLVWPEAMCVIAAAARQQAEILFNQAISLIRRAELEDIYAARPGLREIRLQAKFKSGSRVRVLSADAGPGDGVIPTLALVDELHRHKNFDLYGVFRDGLGPRNGQMITISTAGAKADSPLGQLRTKAHDMPSFRRVGTRNEARSADGSFVWIEHCLLDTDDTSKIGLVKKANPASWVTKEWLTERQNSPTMTPGQWLRYACGIWTEGDEPWIEPADWDRLAVDIGGVKDGDEVYLAVRAAAGVGIGIASPRDNGVVAVRAEIMLPPAGGRVPLEVVERTLRELCERYNVREVAFDPEQFKRSAELLTGTGLPMMEIPQRPMRLAQATATLWRLVSAGLLRHDGSPGLRSQVLLGRTKETVQGWYLVPTAQTAGLIAVAMAVHQATQSTPTEFWVVPSAT
jgi:phage terminase large subunit-like protein